MLHHHIYRGLIVLCCLALIPALSVAADEAPVLHVGAATVEITPSQPVALAGQRRVRIAREAATPLHVAALAIDSRIDDQSRDYVIFLACDLVAIRPELRRRVRELAGESLPDIDPLKLVLSATHTHTAPITREGVYTIEDESVITAAEYVDFAAQRIVQAAAQAWAERRPATASWGLDHAVTAYNRRAVYTDGTAQMYGRTHRDNFRAIEGYEDQAVEALFFWEATADGPLIATVINVASPAQQVEHLSVIHADFWHPVRQKLWEKHGPNLHVIPWIGAAGDQSPRPMFRREAEERMLRLRQSHRLDELARRIVRAWDDIHDVVQHDRHANVPFAHRAQTIELTPRHITAQEYESAKASVAALTDPSAQSWSVRWHQSVVDRYEQQQTGTQPPYAMELHAVRLGDVAIATNEFELFTAFGVQIKARSPALQTFIIQLAGPGTYVPTAEAVRGGGYSAVAESSHVGPEGGQELVDQTLTVLRSLWPAP